VALARENLGEGLGQLAIVIDYEHARQGTLSREGPSSLRCGAPASMQSEVSLPSG
jgi:hypothetical protein